MHREGSCHYHFTRHPKSDFLPKKAFFSDTVLVEMAQKLRVARVKFGVFPGAKIGGKKTKISRKFESEDFLKNV